MMKRSLYLLFMTVVMAACSPVIRPCPHPPAGDVVYVVGQGWHAEIGIPVEELNEDLAFYRKVFPGARTIMFGYAKKTFVTSPPETISEYILGPLPGTATVHAVGLRVTPLEAYPPEATITLSLPPGGIKALCAYIKNDLATDTSGNPRIVAHSTNPDGLFYAARSQYNLLHTCNTWTANALHQAGLPISGDGVIFSGQTMTRANNVAETQCRLR